MLIFLIFLFFFFFLSPNLNFASSYRAIIGYCCFYYPISCSGKRRVGRTSETLPEQVISGRVCSPGGHRKQVAVLIVLAPTSCPSWRQFRSGQEVSGLLCPPGLRNVPGQGNCLVILTAPSKLCGYLAEGPNAIAAERVWHRSWNPAE